MVLHCGRWQNCAMGLITSMREWLLRREAPPCPACRNQAPDLLEWDEALKRFACAVCSHQWRPSPPRSAA
jgi:hypothetical protein